MDQEIQGTKLNHKKSLVGRDGARYLNLRGTKSMAKSLVCKLQESFLNTYERYRCNVDARSCQTDVPGDRAETGAIIASAMLVRGARSFHDARARLEQSPEKRLLLP